MQSKPLSPQVFQILLSVVDGPRHGYAIITEVQERSKGEIRLTASTLYDALARLLDERLVKEVDAPPEAAGSAERRRYYQLTAPGRDALLRETARLERLLASAREKNLQPSRGRGSR